MLRKACEKVRDLRYPFRIVLVEIFPREGGTPHQIVLSETGVLLKNGFHNGEASVSGVKIVGEDWREALRVARPKTVERMEVKVEDISVGTSIFENLETGRLDNRR